MIELTFGESAGGGLKLAKSMQFGDSLTGATAIFGDAPAEAVPRVWTGRTIGGNADEVVCMTLALDIGDLSGMDGDMQSRRRALAFLYGDYPGVTEELFAAAQSARDRLYAARERGEPVRLWAAACDPAEACALRWVCHFLDGSSVPLLWAHEDETYLSIGELPPEAFGDIAAASRPISPAQRLRFASEWRALVAENARLRAVINGRVMGVPEDFYDFALRANQPEGEFLMARWIGKTLVATPGVGDRWLYLRIRRMIDAGELIELSPPTADSPYASRLRRPLQQV